MPRGGRRQGAGRPYGAITLKSAIDNKTRAIVEAALEAGELPICYMLRIMRDEKISTHRRDDMAKAASNFLTSRPWLTGSADEPEPDADEADIAAAPAANDSAPATPAEPGSAAPAEAHEHLVAVAAE